MGTTGNTETKCKCSVDFLMPYLVQFLLNSKLVEAGEGQTEQ